MKKRKHPQLTHAAQNLINDLIRTTANKHAAPEETDAFKKQAQSELVSTKLKLEKYILRLQIKGRR